MADATHGTFDDILILATPPLRPLCVQLRAAIAGLHAGCVEVAWPRQRIVSFGFGPKKLTEHYAYIAVHGAHINLGFYRGTTLPDPKGLLGGTGKALRHVQLTDMATAKSAAVKALLRAAIAERKQALHRKG